jgi:hypothetical protein
LLKGRGAPSKEPLNCVVNLFLCNGFFTLGLIYVAHELPFRP